MNVLQPTLACIITCPEPGLVVTNWKFSLNLIFFYLCLCHSNEAMAENKAKLIYSCMVYLLFCMDWLGFEKFVNLVSPNHNSSIRGGGWGKGGSVFPSAEWTFNPNHLFYIYTYARMAKCFRATFSIVCNDVKGIYIQNFIIQYDDQIILYIMCMVSSKNNFLVRKINKVKKK